MALQCAARPLGAPPARRVGRPPARCLAVRASGLAPEHDGLSTGRRQALLAGASLASGLLLPDGAGWSGAAAAAEEAPGSSSVYRPDLTALMFGEELPFDRYKGQVGRQRRWRRQWRRLHARRPVSLAAAFFGQMAPTPCRFSATLPQVLLVLNVASE